MDNITVVDLAAEAVLQVGKDGVHFITGTGTCTHVQVRYRYMY